MSNLIDEDGNEIGNPEQFDMALFENKMRDITCAHCGKTFKGIPMRMPQYCSECSEFDPWKPLKSDEVPKLADYGKGAITYVEKTKGDRYRSVTGHTLDVMLERLNEKHIPKDKIVSVIYNPDRCEYCAIFCE